MYQLQRLTILAAILTSSCANPHPPVDYPAGTVGELVRTFHTGNEVDATHAMTVLWQQDHPGQEGPTEAERRAAIPALLQIVATDKTNRAFMAADIIHDLQPSLLLTAPEFRQIRARAVKALDHPEIIERPKGSPPIPVGSTALLLIYMGPDSYRDAFDPLARIFLAPIDKPIEEESGEAWKYLFVQNMLATFGARAAPVFARGLSHKASGVRECSLEGLANLANIDQLGPPFTNGSFRSVAEIAAARAAARGAMPQIIECLWDPEKSVADQALRTIGRLGDASDSSPRLIAKLFDPSAGYNASDALAAVHPAVTPQLFRLALSENQAVAKQALSAIGGPVVPELLLQLDAHESTVHEILANMNFTALPALGQAARSNTGPAREAAAAAYRSIFTAHRKQMTETIAKLEKLDPATMPPEIDPLLRLTYISGFRYVAPAAASAIPLLEKIGANKDDPYAPAARDTLEKIRREQLPEDPLANP